MLIKGVGKQVVVLKNTNSDYFEEAIFIMKENKKVSQKELLRECEEIINKNILDTDDCSKKYKHGALNITLVCSIVLFSVFSLILAVFFL